MVVVAEFFYCLDSGVEFFFHGDYLVRLKSFRVFATAIQCALVGGIDFDSRK